MNNTHTRPKTLLDSRAGKTIKQLLIVYLPVTLVMIFCLFPFYWAFVTSLKNNVEIFDFTGNLFLVKRPSLDNYIYLFQRTLFLRWFSNTVAVAGVTTVFSVAVSIMAGYAIARLRFRGATLFGLLIFITYLVPRTLLFIPLAQVLNQFNVLGHPITLYLSYPTFLIPFCTWLLTGYFRTIPVDLEEVARIDGCTRLGAVVRIVLPLAVPGILTAAIFSFTLSWTDLLYALTFVSGDSNKTLTLGTMSTLVAQDYYFWGPLMSATIVASIPVAVLYFFFVDYYVSGLTAGALKG